MIQVRLVRLESSDRGTIGALLVEDQFVCMTLERPWCDNKINISCVPKDTYIVSAYNSSKFGSTYIIEDVPGRSGILFHKGNEISDTSGCVLLGQEIRPNGDTVRLVGSKLGFDRFVNTMLRRSMLRRSINKASPFKLRIE